MSSFYANGSDGRRYRVNICEYSVDTTTAEDTPAETKTFEKLHIDDGTLVTRISKGKYHFDDPITGQRIVLASTDRQAP